MFGSSYRSWIIPAALRGGYFSFILNPGVFTPRYALKSLRDCVTWALQLDFRSGTDLPYFYANFGGRDNFWLRQWPALSNDRPILAMAAGKWGVHPWSRCFSQALELETESELLVSHMAAERWTEQKYTSEDDIGGIIAIDADCITPGTPVKYWWVLGTNGLFRSEEYPDNFTNLMKNK